MAGEREVVRFASGALSQRMGGEEVTPAGVKTTWHGRGSLVCSSMLAGRDPRTSAVPADLHQEVQLLFRNIDGFMQAAGGGIEQIIDVTFYVMDEWAATPIVERAWSAMFPDTQRQPPHPIWNAAPVGLRDERVGAFIVGCVA